MKKIYLFLLLCSVLGLNAQTYEGLELIEKTTTPVPVSVYKLKNGFRVYVVHSSDTVLRTQLVVNAGMADDFLESKGIAMLVQELMYSGSGNLGTYSSLQEKPILDHINSTYEVLKKMKGQREEFKVNGMVDRISLRASTYGIPDEIRNIYDTYGITEDGYVTDDVTVYDASMSPAVFENWLKVQNERFYNPSFRYLEKCLTKTNDKVVAISRDAIYRKSMVVRQAFEGDGYEYGMPEPATGLLAIPDIEALKAYYSRNYKLSNMFMIVTGSVDAYKTAVMVQNYMSYLPGNTEGSKRPFIKPPLIIGRSLEVNSDENNTHYVVALGLEEGKAFWYPFITERILQDLAEKFKLAGHHHAHDVSVKLYPFKKNFYLQVLSKGVVEQETLDEFLLYVKSNLPNYAEIERARETLATQWKEKILTNPFDAMQLAYLHDVPVDALGNLLPVLKSINADTLVSYLRNVFTREHFMVFEKKSNTPQKGFNDTFHTKPVYDNTHIVSFFRNGSGNLAFGTSIRDSVETKTAGAPVIVNGGARLVMYQGNDDVQKIRVRYYAGKGTHSHAWALYPILKQSRLFTGNAVFTSEVKMSESFTDFYFTIGGNNKDILAFFNPLPSRIPDRESLKFVYPNMQMSDAWYKELEDAYTLLLQGEIEVTTISREALNASVLKLQSYGKRNTKIAALKSREVKSVDDAEKDAFRFRFVVEKYKKEELIYYYFISRELFYSSGSWFNRTLNFSKAITGEVSGEVLHPGAKKSPFAFCAEGSINFKDKAGLIKYTDSLMNLDTFTVHNFEWEVTKIKNQIYKDAMNLTAAERDEIRKAYGLKEDFFVFLSKEAGKLKESDVTSFYAKKIRKKPYLLYVYLQ